MWVRAYSPYDISRYLLVQAVRSTNTRDYTTEEIKRYWRRCAHSVGLDRVEDRVYHMVWKDVVHSLLAEFREQERARLVDRYMNDQ